MSDNDVTQNPEATQNPPWPPDDPISSGRYTDPEAGRAMVRIRLLSGRVVEGALIAESDTGVTIQVEGWEYTFAFSRVEWVAKPPSAMVAQPIGGPDA